MFHDNATITYENIVGSRNNVSGGILNSSIFRVRGHGDIAHNDKVAHLGDIRVAGSSSDITFNFTGGSHSNLTVSGSKNGLHINNGTIDTLMVTGSSDSANLNGTTVYNREIQGSNDSVVGSS